MSKAIELQKVMLPVVDFGRALEISDRFNIATQSQKARRVRKILGDALDFMQTIVPDIKAGKTIEAGSHHGMDPFLNVELGGDIGRRKDRIAYLAGAVPVELLQRHATILTDVRRAFKLSSDTQAAVLSVRIYQKVVDHLWRGNGLGVDEPGSEFRSLNTDNLRERLTRPRP